MAVHKNLEIILKQNEKNKLSHAFLVETNNIDLAIKDIKEILKAINCPNKYKENCNNCNLCKLIDLENLPSLQIISSDSQTIKKEQISSLEIKFSTKPIYSKYNMYLIISAEKLNTSSGSSLLKFLEEPEDNIIGFLIVNNKEKVLSTIRSRCELIYANYEVEEIIDKDLEDTVNNYLEKIKYTNSYLINKEIILEKYQSRENIEQILLIIFNKYYQMYLEKINTEKEKYEQILEIIKNKLILIKYNVNLELLLDSFLIEMRRISD